MRVARADLRWLLQAMRPDRMTTKSQKRFAKRIDAAARRGSPEIVPEHLILAMLDQDDGIARPLLGKTGADIDALEAAATARVEKLPRVTGGADRASRAARSKSCAAPKTKRSS